MRIVNEVLGTSDRLKALLDMDIDGSVSMLPLLKFRERAFYEDGRATTLTGAEAYQVYLRELTDRMQTVGGRVVLSNPTQYVVLGQVEDLWDAVLVVEYPSKEAFVDLVTSPEIQAAGASIAGQASTASC